MLMAFYGAEKGAEYGRKREDTVEQQFHEMVQADW
jgi:hypothetical protein